MLILDYLMSCNFITKQTGIPNLRTVNSALWLARPSNMRRPTTTYREKAYAHRTWRQPTQA